MICTRYRAVVPALMLVFLIGCGAASDGRAVVKGKLVEGGKPFVLDQSKLKLPKGATGLPPGTRPLAVTFIPADGGTPAIAAVDPETGTFTVTGPEGKGIKPGRYKIAISCDVGGGDYFSGKYAPDKTQISRDVKSGEDIVIDLTNPQG